MLYIATHVCGKPCEMLLDTGSEFSVISLPTARRLGLEPYIDRRMQGVAAGVGVAPILGRLHSVPVMLGPLSVTMDFEVLQVDEAIIMLGMDIMKKYRCVVDMERGSLRIGGHELPFLPPSPQRVKPALVAEVGCPMM